MKYIIKLMSLLAILSLCIPAFALQRPEVELKNVTDQMLNALKQESNTLNKNPNRLFSIVNHILIPHVDIEDMARWVIGRNTWMKASLQERSQFSSEFKKLLIKTYSSNLTDYSNQTIEYLPVREDMASKSRVQVSTLIKSADRETVRVAYRLKKMGDSWMLYDISVEGVSLLRGFKAQFESEAQTSGLGAVIKKIQMHNQNSGT